MCLHRKTELHAYTKGATTDKRRKGLVRGKYKEGSEGRAEAEGP